MSDGPSPRCASSLPRGGRGVPHLWAGRGVRPGLAGWHRPTHPCGETHGNRQCAHPILNLGCAALARRSMVWVETSWCGGPWGGPGRPWVAKNDGANEQRGRWRGTGLTHPPTRRAPSVSLPPRTPRQLTPLLIRHTHPSAPHAISIHWIPAKQCPGCGSAQVCVGLMRRGGPRTQSREPSGLVAERIQASPHDTQLLCFFSVWQQMLRPGAGKTCLLMRRTKRPIEALFCPSE
jgi:hypothetical protein